MDQATAVFRAPRQEDGDSRLRAAVAAWVDQEADGAGDSAVAAKAEGVKAEPARRRMSRTAGVRSLRLPSRRVRGLRLTRLSGLWRVRRLGPMRLSPRGLPGAGRRQRDAEGWNAGFGERCRGGGAGRPGRVVGARRQEPGCRAGERGRW